jgi:hypothetical protein
MSAQPEVMIAAPCRALPVAPHYAPLRASGARFAGTPAPAGFEPEFS